MIFKYLLQTIVIQLSEKDFNHQNINLQPPTRLSTKRPSTPFFNEKTFSSFTENAYILKGWKMLKFKLHVENKWFVKKWVLGGVGKSPFLYTISEISANFFFTFCAQKMGDICNVNEGGLCV